MILIKLTRSNIPTGQSHIRTDHSIPPTTESANQPNTANSNVPTHQSNLPTNPLLSTPQTHMNVDEKTHSDPTKDRDYIPSPTIAFLHLPKYKFLATTTLQRALSHYQKDDVRFMHLIQNHSGYGDRLYLHFQQNAPLPIIQQLIESIKEDPSPVTNKHNKHQHLQIKYVDPQTPLPTQRETFGYH